MIEVVDNESAVREQLLALASNICFTEWNILGRQVVAGISELSWKPLPDVVAPYFSITQVNLDPTLPIRTVPERRRQVQVASVMFSVEGRNPLYVSEAEKLPSSDIGLAEFVLGVTLEGFDTHPHEICKQLQPTLFGHRSPAQSKRV